ncbi:MAG: flagellar basal body P-ring formation protein FlgA [Spirochaetaceae bacterium]|nr:MAG: flagellar basal body P-ring formation protein FlgA [Spirochaetaceae bacterium]
MNKSWRRVLLSILVLVGLFLTKAAIATPGSAVPADSVTVYLRQSAVLDGPEYTLEQVASVFSPDPARAQALRQLPIGATPIRPTLLPARAIQERIAPIVGKAIVIGGRIAILPARTIPDDEVWFYTALLAFVDRLDAPKQGRIEIELLNSPLLLESFGGTSSTDYNLASGWEDRILFEVSRSPYSSGFRSSLSWQDLPAGTMQLTYRILAAGTLDVPRGGNLEGSLRLWLHHFLPVGRAAADLPANQELSESMLVFTEEDVSLLKSSFVVQGEGLENYKTVASLRRGELIEGGRLQRVPAVRAGDRVTITFVRPGLLVSLPGRAMRSGSLGDLIDVRPEATSKRFQARITAKGEVIVESH